MTEFFSQFLSGKLGDLTKHKWRTVIRVGDTVLIDHEYAETYMTETKVEFFGTPQPPDIDIERMEVSGEVIQEIHCDDMLVTTAHLIRVRVGGSLHIMFDGKPLWTLS